MLSRARPPGPRSRREPRRYAPGPWLALFAVGLALRVTVLAATAGRAPAVPARLEDVARQVATGHGYAVTVGARRVPTAEFPPLAPALLAAAQRTGMPSPWAAALALALVGACLPLLVRWLAESMFGAVAGRAAGWACALDPLLVVAPPALVQPLAVGAAVTLALGLSSAWLKTARAGRALGVGVALGLATLTGGAAIVVLPVVLAWAWVPLGLILPGLERRRQLLLVAAGLVAVLTPWAVRNALVVRAFAPWSTSTGPALLAGNDSRAWTDPERRGAPVDVLSTPEFAAGAGRGEGARDLEAARAAGRHVTAHAASLPAAVGAKLARTAWPLDEARASAWPPPVALPLAIAVAAWTAFAAWGTFRALGGARRWYQSLPVLVVIAGLVVTAVTFGGLGPRLTFEPLVALMAGIGFDDARRRARSGRRGLRLVRGRPTAATEF